MRMFNWVVANARKVAKEIRSVSDSFKEGKLALKEWNSMTMAMANGFLFT